MLAHKVILCRPQQDDDAAPWGQTDLKVFLFIYQVDFAKVLHYVGAGVAFPSSMLFVCLQSTLTYKLAKTQEEYRVGHLRGGMALLALVALVLSILTHGDKSAYGVKAKIYIILLIIMI